MTPEMHGHGYTWDQLRDRPLVDLDVGATYVTPDPFTACRVAKDGTVRGVGWRQPGGTAWTITSRDGTHITGRSHTGEEQSGHIPSDTYSVLAVKT